MDFSSNEFFHSNRSKNMNYLNLLKILIVTLIISSPALATIGPIPGCHTQVQQNLGERWLRIGGLFEGCQELAHASYKGRGEQSHSVYLLHLIPYEALPQTYIAFIMTEGNPNQMHAAVGFIRPRAFGIYDWHGLRVVRGDIVEPALNVQPISTLTIELGSSRQVESITIATNAAAIAADQRENEPAPNIERIVLQNARTPLLEPDLVPGYFRSSNEEHSLTSSRSAELENSAWHIQRTDSNRNQNTIVRSALLPGVFRVQNISSRQYVDFVENQVTSLLFNIRLWTNIIDRYQPHLVELTVNPQDGTLSPTYNLYRPSRR